MKPIASRLSLIVTGGVLLAGMLLLTASRLEYCGGPEVQQPPSAALAAPDAPAPTLAPPMKVVVVRIQADKSDLEVSWLGN